MTAPDQAGNARLVVVGVSLGGLHALKTLLGGLPQKFPWPVAITQHRSAEAEDLLAPLLHTCCRLPISDVVDKEPIQPGHVYLAPADYHLLVERGSFTLSREELVNFSRPAIDLLFESAADAYGSGVIAIILTGANHDGAAGAAYVKARGGLLLVQDPASAEAPSMPRAALKAAKADAVLPLDAIAGWLAQQACPHTHSRP